MHWEGFTKYLAYSRCRIRMSGEIETVDEDEIDGPILSFSTVAPEWV